jgi:hypothetical protein
MRSEYPEAIAYALQAVDRSRALGDVAAEACARGEIARNRVASA